MTQTLASLILAHGLLNALVACEQSGDASGVVAEVGQRAARADRDDADGTGTDTNAANTADEPASHESFERFPGSAFEVANIVSALATSAFRDLRPVGTTSVVMRANLDAPFRAALKLATYDRPLGPAAEAAAYRLSRCLGLTTVPPVMLRRVSESALALMLDPRFAERWAELSARVVFDGQREAEAAAVFWIEGMRELPLAAGQARDVALRALAQGVVNVPQQQLMAAQLSDLIAFDLLIGNGDRWSGGNVQGDLTGQWLYIRDHDLAFASRLRPEVQSRLVTELGHVERFSRRLVERLRALTAERYEREWRRDPLLAQREPWLRDRVLPGVLERRQQLLRHVDALVARYGEDAVLEFP